MRTVPLGIVLAATITLLAAVRSEVDETLLPPPRHGGVYVVAHRGAHGEGIPENTLAAYEKAIELGVDFVEIDVRTTRDGAFVSVHNSAVDAYTGGAVTGAVRDMTLAELKALDIGSRVGPEWAQERIPAFDEILELCKGRAGIYLDLKDAPIAPLVDRVKAHGMERAVLWYIPAARVEELRALCPACIPMPDPGPEERLPALLDAAEPPVVAAVWRHFSPGFVEKCHAAGALVIVDESTPDCWDDALAWGADGIQTDHPRELIEYLKQRETKAAERAE